MAQVDGDWEIRWSQSKQKPYFYSNKLKKSSWDPPIELTHEQIEELPGANLLHGAVTSQGLGGALSEGQKGKVRASHLLVKHNHSRKPSSWKEATITRSKEEAISILKGYEEELKGKSNPEEMKKKFEELAKENSDCSSHTHGGDLGFFGPGQMQKPFEDSTFKLSIGEISTIVETESGVHLILRTA